MRISEIEEGGLPELAEHGLLFCTLEIPKQQPQYEECVGMSWRRCNGRHMSVGNIV